MKRLLRLLQRLPASLWLFWGFLAGLLFMFALLAEEMVERETIGFDQAILEALDRWRAPGLDVVAGVLNVVGGSYFLAPLTVVVSILLWRRWSRSAVFVGLAVFGAMALSGLAKLIFERPRPQVVEALVHAEGFSFPSGHAMSSTAVALAAYFSIRALAPAWRWPALAIGGVFALAVGVSRSYLLVHYPSDVIAGWILATAWVLGVHAAFSFGAGGRRGPRSPSPTSEAKPDAASTEASNHRGFSTTSSPRTRSTADATRCRGVRSRRGFRAMSAGGVENDVASWFERLARLGYFVKGIVYVTIGLLAGQVALGTGGRTTGSTGALVSLSRQPSGAVMIGVVALGLAGYALWRLTQAVWDVEGKGWDAKGLLKRVGYLVSGLAYASISLEAWRLLLQFGVSSDSQSQELWTARILTLPWGRWLVAAGALALFALAVNAGVVAFRRMYRDKLDLADMSAIEERVADVTAISGLIGRGAVFVVIGIFLGRAALFLDAQEAGSSAEALATVARAPYGVWLLGGLAVGLIAYGGYAFMQARYRQIDVLDSRTMP